MAVPRTAAFILADDPVGWAGEHQLGIYKQWTRFRVAILGSIWQTRCSRGDSSWDQSFARRAAELATNTLRGEPFAGTGNAPFLTLVSKTWALIFATTGGVGWMPLLPQKLLPSNGLALRFSAISEVSFPTRAWTLSWML